jgi:hypothetical protein
MIRYAILAGLLLLAALAIYHPAPKPPAVVAASAYHFTPAPAASQHASRRRTRRHHARRTRHRLHRPHRRSRRRGRPAVVDLNTAGQTQLAAIPGIGPALAERIVTMRSLEGPYASLDQLLDVAGMTARRLDRATPYLSVVRRPRPPDE